MALTSSPSLRTGRLLAGAACLTLAAVLGSLLTRRKVETPWIPAPRAASPDTLSADERARHPYPPDVLPGGRDVETPYGAIRVFEFGPPDGDKVLLLHGLATPSPALADMAEALAEHGHRVMLFDFFGRGYSDAPVDLPYDERLFTTQVLLALASSPLAWAGDGAFHLVGFSWGGGVAAVFAGYYPRAVRSLVLVAPGGLVRAGHFGWRSRLLYAPGLLPSWLSERLVRARLAPRETTAGAEMAVDGAEAPAAVEWDDVVLSRRRPLGSVAAVMRWQLAAHPGYVRAFMATIRHIPIYGPVGPWRRLGGLLAERRAADPPPGLVGGRVLLVLGAADVVIVKEEVVPDTRAALGDEAVEAVVFNCGHEVGIVKGAEVARAAIRFWESAGQGGEKVG